MEGVDGWGERQRQVCWFVAGLEGLDVSGGWENSVD